MIKILFVINHLSGGGAERVFVDMLKNMDRNKYDISVLVVHDCGIYTKEVRRLVKYHSIIKETNKKGAVRKVYRGMCILGEALMKFLPSEVLHRWFVKERFDIEVAYIEGPATKITAGAPENVLTYAWVHTNVIENPWASAYYRNEREEEKCYRRIHRIVGVSDAVKDSIYEKYELQAAVRYNILDDRNIREIAGRKKRKLQTGTGCVFVSVGSLWYVKGYIRLVNIAAELIHQGYDLELHLIGDGVERTEIEEIVREKRVEDKIILHGFIREPYDLLSQADIYICPSYVEGFSTSVTEALILGLPVITTDCSGMRELLGESEYGMIVENSERGLREGMERFLKSPEELEYYREQSEKRGKDFIAQVQVKKLEKMFEESLMAEQKEL